MLLRLEGVSKSYAASADSPVTPVLSKIDLEVAEGDLVGIVGPSGSGKSTLLNIIGSLDTPSQGRVLLNGRDLATLREKELSRVRASDLGLVFQLHHLLPQCSVIENVLVPTLALGAKPKPAAIERANRLLDRVGLAARANYLPAQLSGGERQRAAVVRALINSPKLVLADEPTGSLDAAAADQLAELLVELNREEGVAMLVITHSPELAKRMGRVLAISDGRLVNA